MLEREKGVLLMPHNIDEKPIGLVIETIMTEHPDGKDSNIKNLPEDEECAELIETQVSGEIAEQVSCDLSVSAGPKGLDSLSLNHWFFKHGGDSMVLWKTVEKMV